MSPTIVNLLDISILDHKSLRTGEQPKHKHFNKTLLFYVYIQRLHEKRRIHLIHSMLFSVTCTTGKVIRHMTSDFDVCEVDLDMQMSFLNDKLFTRNVLIFPQLLVSL